MELQFLIKGLLLLGALSTFAQNLEMCHPTAESGQQYNVTGIFEINTTKTFAGILWRGQHPDFSLSCIGNGRCVGDDSYDGSLRGNESTLVFEDVEQGDAGPLSIKVRYTESSSSPVFDVCDFVVASKPSCNIVSSIQSDDLDLGDNVTLTLDLEGYFCSKPISFNLTTEKVMDPVLIHQTVQGSTNWAFQDNFTMTLARFGNVSMTMVCGDTDWRLNCDGVQSLIMSPPKCNISCAADPYNLDLGKNVTLIVAIDDYYCPRSTEFKIKTGSVEQVLLTNHSVKEVSDVIEDVNFLVTSSRLGDVNLTYTCDLKTFKLDCDGVDILKLKVTTTTPMSTVHHVTTAAETSEKPPTSPSPSDSIPRNTDKDLNIPLIAGAAGGGLLLLVLVALVIVNRRKLKDVAHIYFVSNRQPSIQYVDGEIPDEYLPEEMKDAVAEDDIRLGSLEQKKDKAETPDPGAFPPFSLTSGMQPFAISEFPPSSD